MTGLFKNEFIMAPLKLGYCSNKDGKVNDRHLKFYKDRAARLGAIIFEPFYIDSGLRENPFQLGIDADDKVEGLKQLVDLVHKTDTRAIAHINHPGRMANAAIPGNYFWSSTDKACENAGATPVSMDETMMKSATNKIIEASMRAQKAGFDFIELQFGYGYLMSQFLSAAINNRADIYGGSLENRMRFPLEVLKQVKNAINIPIIARLSADDFLPNGTRIEEAIAFSKELVKSGVVALHVTLGSACTSPAWYYQHMFIPKGKNWEYAAKIKESVEIPVFFHGRIHSKQDIELLKENYGAEYFSIGRALIADENFAGKITHQINEPVRPCLACSEGCLGGVRAGKGLGCVVNPLVNAELPEISPAEKSKKIAVIGGGIAGMQAAITLHARGHQVEVFEKDKLGGQFILAYLPPKKESLREIVDYYISEIDRLGIKVRYQEATKELISDEGFDELVMATGAVPAIPPIKGLTDFLWAEILHEKITPANQNMVIVGGGLIGCEIASKLLDNGNKVTIVEMLDEIARGLELIERNMTLKKFKENNVKIFLKHKVTEVQGKTLIMEDENENTVKLENVDKIVMATGMKSYRPFETNIPGHFVGDAKLVAKAQEAIHDAYTLALNI